MALMSYIDEAVIEEVIIDDVVIDEEYVDEYGDEYIINEDVGQVVIPFFVMDPNQREHDWSSKVLERCNKNISRNAKNVLQVFLPKNFNLVYLINEMQSYRHNTDNCSMSRRIETFLSGIDLTGYNLHGINLSNLLITGTNFTNTNFGNKNTCCHETIFVNCRMNNTNFQSASMINCSIIDGNCDGAIFSNALLCDTLFERTTFRAAIFNNSNLCSASIRDCYFDKVIMHESSFDSAQFDNVQFAGCHFNKVSIKSAICIAVVFLRSYFHMIDDANVSLVNCEYYESINIVY